MVLETEPPTLRGTFGGGTLSPHKQINMYDSSQPYLDATLGPCEAETVVDQPTAQDHYYQREIKLRDPRGRQFEPQTSYTHHYPAKALPHTEVFARPDLPGAPFTASSTYTNAYDAKPLPSKYGADPKSYQIRALPMIQAETTNQRFYRPWPISGGGSAAKTQPPADLGELDMGSFLQDTFQTTNNMLYPPKQSAYLPPHGTTVAQPLGESRVKTTTHDFFYTPKLVTMVSAIPREPPSAGAPFTATSTYRVEYVPKQLPHELPHLTGFQAREGLRLPLPRKSLGVEVVGDSFFVLIPFSTPAPATARQIFTTVHDNQDQACILILYGESATASQNTLLGQFDIINIPPAPKDVPQIEVTFHLDANLVLTAEARDLDTGRHKLWKQNGGTIVLR
ncbi:hypothetical protein WJX72_004919 [[Myrmecia] bisecta]|uniref:Uncharacterized protein n=1 Tax=[Myrmecia] bisecta TaxID=41462 RepID=A0AAW1PD16_9CHLO